MFSRFKEDFYISVKSNSSIYSSMKNELSVTSKKSLPLPRYRSFVLCLTPKVIHLHFYSPVNVPLGVNFYMCYGIFSLLSYKYPVVSASPVCLKDHFLTELLLLFLLFTKISCLCMFEPLFGLTVLLQWSIYLFRNSSPSLFLSISPTFLSLFLSHYSPDWLHHDLKILTLVARAERKPTWLQRN